MDKSLLYLSKHEVELICEDVDPVGIIADVLSLHSRGETVLPDEAYLMWASTDGDRLRSLNMPSYIGGEYQIAGTKIINANPSNFRFGLPRASGFTMLFDVNTAEVISIMEGAYISSLRTASVTALATKLLSRTPIDSVSIIGAGVQAKMHIRMLMRYFKEIENVFIYDLSKASISALIDELKDSPVKIYPVSTAEEAIRKSKLIIPLTTTTSGYIEYDWIQPGSILVNVSLDDPLPEVALKCDKLYVDDWHLVKTDDKRLLGRMYRQGLITAEGDEQKLGRKIDGELGQLINEEINGRSNDEEIIFVNPFGLSIEDIAVAHHVFQIAKTKNIGTFLCR